MLVFLALLSCGWFISVWMPGKSYTGKLPVLTAQETTLANNLASAVKAIAFTEHNFSTYQELVKTAKFLEQKLESFGYQVNHKTYQINQQIYDNLEVEIKGSSHPEEIVIIGAHYDSVINTSGANDNGSGAAAVLELARIFAKEKTGKTLRFVEFVNEEPPFFHTDQMGSLVYAKISQKKQEKIVAMLSLETMGYYTNAPHTQSYPFPLSLCYPSAGNFITFIGNFSSRNLVHQAINTFRQSVKFPSEGVVLPSDFPGVGWSDQWSFWQQGYQGIMVTDTAPARYPYYHTVEDTLDKINYEALARVVTGLEGVIKELVK